MKTPNLDAALDVGKQRHSDHLAQPVLKYLGHLDTVIPSFSQPYQRPHLQHHQLIHPTIHTAQYHRQPSVENVHLRPKVLQKEILAAFPIKVVPTYALPYDAHQLQVYLKQRPKFDQTARLSSARPSNLGHAYMPRHQFQIFLHHFLQAVDSSMESAYAHGHAMPTLVPHHHTLHAV